MDIRIAKTSAEATKENTCPECGDAAFKKPKVHSRNIAEPSWIPSWQMILVASRRCANCGCEWETIEL